MRSWTARTAIGGAGLLLVGALAVPLVAPAGADTAAVTDTDPSVFASSFTAQALVPYTSATLQVDDSYAWVHGFFSKGQPDSAINAAEYSEAVDPGFVAGAVLFSSSSDPTPLADPNNFPGYAWASYPVPAGQTDVEKCVNPQNMVPTPCNAQAPDQSIATIDPSAPKGSALVTASGPTGGDVGGTFSSSSHQSITPSHAVAVHADASGHNVSFAGGQLQVAAFQATADISSKADGTATGSASCVAGAFTIMGQTVQAGPGGTIDTSQIQPLLDQLGTATGNSYTVSAPAPPTITKNGSAVEASCQGPAITISHPLPGPLATLNVGQTFILGSVDIKSGASPNPNSSLSSASDSGVALAGSSDASNGATPALPSSDASTAAAPSPASTGSTGADLTGTSATGSSPAAPSTPAPAAAPSPAAPAGNGTANPALALRPIGHHAKDWWPFILTLITGFTIVGTGAGLFSGFEKLAQLWRERVAPIG